MGTGEGIRALRGVAQSGSPQPRVVIQQSLPTTGAVIHRLSPVCEKSLTRRGCASHHHAGTCSADAPAGEGQTHVAAMCAQL